MKRKANIIARSGEKPLHFQDKTNLRLIIKRTGFTQKQLAAHLDVSSSTISAWVQGARIPKDKKINIKTLSDYLKRKEEELKGLDLELMLLVGNSSNLKRWKTYMITFPAPLYDDWQNLLLVLNDIGVLIPETPDMIDDGLSQFPENVKDAEFHRKNVGKIDPSLKKGVVDPRNYDENRPFDSLIYELLTNLYILKNWCDTFLPKTKEGELTNTSKKIKNRLLDVAFLKTKVVDLVAETGTDVDDLIEKNNEIISEVNNLIGVLCDELLEKGNSIRTDYFEFVKLNPNQLQKRIKDYEIHTSKKERHINDYLKYGERKIASQVDQTLDWQRKIFRKIETLTKTQEEIIERIKHNEQLLNKIL